MLFWGNWCLIHILPLNEGSVRLRNIVNELASDAVRAVPVDTVVLANFGLIHH